VGQRTSDLFCYSAKKSGSVRSIDEHGIIVDYVDGETQGFELGRRFGNAAGLTIAHSVVTQLKVGEKFDKGQVIVYNDGYFEPEFFEPKNIVMKMGMEVTTVILESALTHEDSSGITKNLSEKLRTNISKVKYIQLRFDQHVSQLIKEGDEVDADTILCIIEDEVTAKNKLFDERSIETLKAISAQTPRAHVKGKVERIEVYYHGDKEDMSESLREISGASDRIFKKKAASVAKTGFTGKVDGGFRIEGTPLPVDTLVIKVYITSSVPAGTGDKGVFASQMKTVFGDMIAGTLRTKDKTPIDAIFGNKSFEDRIVNSPFLIGTTTTLLKVGGKNAVDIYFGKKK
jgi:hypothetical protein